MQGMKKTKPQQCNIDCKKKERHIVTWSQEEDNILREQISIHGTENWAIIASKFKDKTTRQCRRRWYTYLNSDFKKGGWSPEEDLLLCEAQKIFGNRWTEIAKVVSGRTDNAVKNRFTTLCKKRAKYEALAKENSSSRKNSNNKKFNFQNDFGVDGISLIESSRKRLRYNDTQTSDSQVKITANVDEVVPLQSRRTHISGITEARKQCEPTIHQQSRAPFTVSAHNAHNLNNLSVQQNHVEAKVINGVQHNKIQGAFLKKDDPKISALMQQAELLASLAQKVNAENTDQSLENAWKVLQEFLNESKETDTAKCKITEIHLDDLKDIVEDLKSGNDGSIFSWRQPDQYENSPGSSEYSTGSTVLPQSAADQLQHSLHQYIETDIKTPDIEEQKRPEECEKGNLSGENMHQATGIFSSFDDKVDIEEALCTTLSAEFSSPLQVTPLFRSLAAGIPSPMFSESERNFLMRTLGIESPSPNPRNNSSQPPPCKRALLQSL